MACAVTLPRAPPLLPRCARGRAARCGALPLLATLDANREHSYRSVRRGTSDQGVRGCRWSVRGTGVSRCG